jgi:pimeloyl-[acyl-carrier protein] methyl ester esterase
LNIKQLILLPGLDGTGELFADFINALPAPLFASPVAYPVDRFLSYSELLPLVASAVPSAESFVLLAESFSTPLAIRYVATQPTNLAALIICAGFATNPVPHLAGLLKMIAKPLMFKLTPPAAMLKHYLAGPDSPPALLSDIRRVLRSVSPTVLSSRLREALDCDVRGELARVAVPVMCLQPANDRSLSHRGIDLMRDAKPDMIVQSIAAPHMILQREPSKSAAVIADFIRHYCSRCHPLDPVDPVDPALP